MTVQRSLRSFFLRPAIFAAACALVAAFFVAVVTLFSLATGQPTALSHFFEGLFPGYSVSWPGLVLGLLWGFVLGFIFGLVLASAYLLLIATSIRRRARPTFDYDPGSAVNVIQQGRGAKPFTVVIAANPVIAHPHDSSFEADPILEQRLWFDRAVVRILRSFANNELLRLPEILPAFRIVAIYDTSRTELTGANSLCESVAPDVNILAPRSDTQIVRDWVLATPGIELSYVDLVFAVSASRRFTRSSARFTADGPDGRPFRFNFNGEPEEKLHAFEARLPGVVALSAWDDRLKTPVHEFAHAISSLENGAIIDEYVDSYAPSTEAALQYVVNRKRRAGSSDAIPDVFGQYDGPYSPAVTYASDRYRADKDATWRSYVPARPDARASCIMDIAYADYRYDNLVFDFLYDKLLVKINRPSS